MGKFSSLSLWILALSMCFSTFAVAQKKNKKADKHLKVVSLGFYNLENLFDTEDDTLINDEEFLPGGARAWTEARYNEKLANMAYVISQVGIDHVKAGLSCLGVSEIENRKVLEDLVKKPSIADRNYQIVHYDSPDKRGVDVGFIYNPKHFQVLASRPIPVYNFEYGKRVFTRDILYIKGVLDLDTVHFMVNHWPSRGGGDRSIAFRNNCAKITRGVVDSLFTINENSKIFIMGDLNDDPTDESLKSYLQTEGNITNVRKTGLFNPYEDFFRRGQGSNAYRDTWSLFDQIIISKGVVNPKNDSYGFLKANIFNKEFLIQSTGQYKGYPYRTFSGDSYQGGYSDHFPSYIYLSKAVD